MGSVETNCQSSVLVLKLEVEQNLPEGNVLQVWNLKHRLTQQNKD